MESQYLHLSKRVSVSVNDADFMGRLKPIAIMEYFQDIATEHADILGIGYDKMLEQNLVWVMSRMSFEVFREIHVGEELRVVTYPEKPKMAEAVRNYQVYSTDGGLAASGSSKWCVLSADTHMIRRCAPLFSYEDTQYHPHQPILDANQKIIMPDLKAGEPVFHSVQLTEIDRNLHMNNSRYGDIILNACDADFLKTHRFSRIDINFISELFAGDRYVVSKAHAGDATFFEANKLETGAAVFRARALWESC